ncbi:MAG TPA: hypothetical protein VJS65_11240, partial [Verrucomicrobiae bacterium]|nr:hypothetical protein [Verrucomicrobiae bacterium]
MLALLLGFPALLSSSRAASYTVNLPVGFTAVANHLAPGSIQTLLGPPSWPQVLEMKADFLTSPYLPSESFINDGTLWLDENATPAVKTIGTGEGMFIYNPGPGPLPITGTISGPASAGISQLNPTAPGWHMRGRQNIGPGTFESVFGRSPVDYAFVHGQRWVNNNYVLYQFVNSPNPSNRKWSPAAPILEVGEAMWFQLGVSTGPANPHYFAPNPVNFTLSGVTPTYGQTLATPTNVSVTGSGFAPGDQIRLRKMGGGPQTPWVTGVADPDGYILTSSFNLGPLSAGYYAVDVRKPPGGTPQTLNNAFRMLVPGSQLTVNLTGPSLALAATPTPMFMLVVANPGGSAVNNVNISAVIPGYPANVTVTLGGVMVSPGFGPPPVPQVGGPGVQTATPFTIPAGGWAAYTFSLTPSLALITTPATTLQLVGQITTPVPQAAQSLHGVEVVASLDPNDKHGPAGVGPARHITGLDPANYWIQFENNPTATAPAHQVVITDQLDVTSFDLVTFQLGAVGFGSKILTPPPALQTWTIDEPYDVDGNPLTTADNILVRMEAELDTNPFSSTYGLVTWTFSSLDAAPPHAPVVLPNVGFLPANVTAPEGQGFVSFQITPWPNLASGQTLENQASIVFDQNPALLTGNWVNTIDIDPPASEVVALPATLPTTSFTVSWAGSDPDSGVAAYDVFVSDDSGPYVAWQTGTEQTSAVFTGQVDHHYRFYSVAVDRVGHREDEPAAADAETTLNEPTSSYSISVPSGVTLFVNQLNHGGNTLNEVLPNAPLETQVWKWDCSRQDFGEPVFFDGTSWINPDGSPSSMTLVPGEGALLGNFGGTPLELTVTGTLPTPVYPPPTDCGCGKT